MIDEVLVGRDLEGSSRNTNTCLEGIRKFTRNLRIVDYPG
jgi:hypothetical protein